MRERTRVLLVEDEPAMARLIKEMLKDVPGTPFALQHAERLSDALAILEGNETDVVLLDLMLPDSMRLDTVHQMVQHFPCLPIVVLTTLHDEQTGIEAVQAGAQDYLFKGEADSALLSRSLKYAMERKRTLEALKESEDRYRTIFETTGTATIILNEGMTISMVNREFEEIFHYVKGEVEGKKKWTQLLAKGQTDRMQEHCSMLLRDPKSTLSAPYECRVVDKEGFIHDVIITVSQVPGTQNCVASLLDITKQKRLQEREKEYLQGSVFLSRSAMKFVEQPTVDAMYRVIAEQLQRRIKNSVLIVGGYSPELQRLQIHAVAGMKRTDSARLQAMGKVFEGMNFKLTDLAKRKCMKGSLERVRGGIRKVAEENAPSGLYNFFDTYFKGRDLHLIGFKYGDELLGIAVVVMGKGSKESKIGDKLTLKTFISNAASALQRKMTEEDLVSAKSRLQRLLVSSPAAIYSAEIQDSGTFTYSYMSDNIKQVIGYEPLEVIGSQSFWQQQIFPEDKRQFLAEDLPKLYRDGNVTAEYRFKGKDGSYRWIQDEMKLICDSEGTPREVMGYLIDTTERKHIEEALMIKHSAMASALEPMILLDHDMTIVYLNDAALALWDYPDMDAVIGKQFAEFLSTRSKYQKLVKSVIEEGSYRGELVGIKRDSS
ncbi:MAG TPA: PAS domain S-box protein, partial [Methanomicrobiales archaeon]|nr:PAS domain S-box protein [Methanomicrobiales archaeon]